MQRSFDKFKPFIRQNSQSVKKTIQARGMNAQTLTDLYHRFVGELVPFEAGDLCCAAGCGYCCHLRVSASLAEVVVIVDHLAKSGRADFFLKRIAESADTVLERAGKEDKWWLENGVPCIFHDERDRLCTIYDIRPFSCRGYHSLDLQLCKKGYTEKTLLPIPCYPDLKRSRELYSLIFAEALTALGYYSPLVELSSMAAALMSRLELMDRWFSGESVLHKI